MALVNYCFAKQHGGEFVLRIEDTDRARSTAESETAILEALRWCGLAWDEGPDVGGPHGPYRQSERSAIYRRYVDELLETGHAFKCFCTQERLEAMRVAQRAAGLPPRYDGFCLALTPAEVARRAGGEPYVVRLKVPGEGICVVEDLRRGAIEFEWSAVDMQVLLKSDGLPTYHLANVVDDHLMEITHVFRGEEWVSSAPKHLLLYKYFGWTPPQLMHLPLLRNPDKSKLSKRKNPTGILFYRAMGYLPEALINFLGLLANSAHDGEADEIMDLAQLVQRFDVRHVPIGGPVFDVPKLDWLNGRYLRERLDAPGFVRAAQTWANVTPERAARIAALAQPRVERLSDLGPLLAFLFSGRLSISAGELRAGAKLDETELRRALALALWELDALPVWNVAGIETTIARIAAALGKKVREVARPFYVAIAGSPTSIPLYDSMELLGRDVVRERLRNALDLVGAPSKREQEQWKAGNL